MTEERWVLQANQQSATAKQNVMRAAGFVESQDGEIEISWLFYLIKCM